jgi:hypothetical protein
MESTIEIRALVAHGRPARANLGYPEAIRRRACAYARARCHAGAGLEAVAAEIGISRTALASWLRAPQRSAALALLPVVVATEGAPVVDPRAPTLGLVLVSPNGFRVEGATVEIVAALLREVG